MSDIVERLKRYSETRGNLVVVRPEEMRLAADEIERLRTDVVIEMAEADQAVADPRAELAELRQWQTEACDALNSITDLDRIDDLLDRAEQP